MQVRIARARHLVQVHRGGEALARQDVHAVATAADEARPPLQVVERGARTARLGGEDGLPDRLVADGGEHAHALGRGEGEIERDVAAATAPGSGERLARDRIAPLQQLTELAIGGPAGQAELGRRAALPAAPNLPALLVVVVAGELGALVVVGPLGGADREHLGAEHHMMQVRPPSLRVC